MIFRWVSLVIVICGVLIFVEINISLLIIGIFGCLLFDKFKVSCECLVYIIDFICVLVSVLIFFNGWGVYLLGLFNENGVEGVIGVLMVMIGFNFYVWIIFVLVFFMVFLNKMFGFLVVVE